MSKPSPLKGIEKITEELKSERIKARHALHERAKLRVELEGIRQLYDQRGLEMEELKHQLEAYHLKEDELQQKIASYEQSKDKMQLDCIKLEQDVNDKNKDLQLKNNIIDELTLELRNKSDESKIMNITIESNEKKLINKDELINQLKEEIETLKLLKNSNELLSFHESSSRMKEMEDDQELNDIQKQNELIKTLEFTLHEIKGTNNQLREELEKTLKTNKDLIKDQRELKVEINQQNELIKQLQNEKIKIIQVEDLKTHKFEEMLKLNEELSHAIELERQSNQAMNNLYQTLLQRKEFFETQWNDIKEKYDEISHENENVTELLKELRQINERLKADCVVWKEKAEEIDALEHQCQQLRLTVSEMDGLRNQLNEMRKQLLRRDLEEEVDHNVSSPRYQLQRELQGKQVYEGIIHELRMEVDRITAKNQEIHRRLDESLRQSSRINQLEDEMNMYKDMASHITMENQTLKFNMSTLTEQNIKYIHEKQSYIHEISQLQSDILGLKNENEILHSEVLELRERMKSIHVQKMSLETKISELQIQNSKLEVSNQEGQHQNNMLEMEINKIKKQFNDNNNENYENQLKYQKINEKLTEKNKLCQELHENLKNEQKKMDEFVKKIQKTEEKYEILFKKSNLLTNQLHEQVLLSNQLTNDIIKYQEENKLIKKDRDEIQQQLQHTLSQSQEIELNLLKKDVDITMYEWNELKKEKLIQEMNWKEYHQVLQSEKEINNQHKKLIEDLKNQLKTYETELSTYQKLNIYQATMKSEMNSYRYQKGKEEGNGRVELRGGGGGTGERGETGQHWEEKIMLLPYQKVKRWSSSGMGSRGVSEMDDEMSEISVRNESRFEVDHGVGRSPVSMMDHQDGNKSKESVSEMEFTPNEQRGRTTNGSVVDEKEGNEKMLKERAARRAIRDQLLRDKIIRKKVGSSVHLIAAQLKHMNNSPTDKSVHSQRSNVFQSSNSSMKSQSEPWQDRRGLHDEVTDRNGKLGMKKDVNNNPRRLDFEKAKKLLS